MQLVVQHQPVEFPVQPTTRSHVCVLAHDGIQYPFFLLEVNDSLAPTRVRSAPSRPLVARAWRASCVLCAVCRSRRIIYVMSTLPALSMDLVYVEVSARRTAHSGRHATCRRPATFRQTTDRTALMVCRVSLCVPALHLTFLSLSPCDPTNM